MREFTARFATAEEIEHWDKHVTANPNGGNLLQSEAFADVKQHFGWKPLHLVYETADYSSYNLVLEKSFPLLGKLWYLIKGPDVAGVEDIPGIIKANREFVKRDKLGVFAVKMEPDIVLSGEARDAIEATGVVKTPTCSRTTPQPCWTSLPRRTSCCATCIPAAATPFAGPSAKALKCTPWNPRKRTSVRCMR
ncbi:catalyzes the incorporation of the first glycine of the pentaglycine interpeptide bridge [Arthrobacter sp. Hiyo8]|nr:catalyzes the incorporation of the first glycine of the pentaglycine interpeptide bridge [Arthrobacter sp. Hiyo8]